MANGNEVPPVVVDADKKGESEKNATNNGDKRSSGSDRERRVAYGPGADAGI